MVTIFFSFFNFKFQHINDRLARHFAIRWLIFGTLMSTYMVRAFYVFGGYEIVSYFLFVYYIQCLYYLLCPIDELKYQFQMFFYYYYFKRFMSCCLRFHCLFQSMPISGKNFCFFIVYLTQKNVFFIELLVFAIFWIFFET